MIDGGLVGKQSTQIAFDEGEVGVEPLQFGQRRLRLLDPIEFGEAGDDIAQPGWPG